MKKLFIFFLSLSLIFIFNFNSFALEENNNLEKFQEAINNSNILDNNYYTVLSTENNNDDYIELESIDEAIKYLENIEIANSKFQEEIVSEDLPALHSRRNKTISKRPKYVKKGFVAKYTLSATIKMDKESKEILKISNPRFTKSGGNGTRLENLDYNTENYGDSAYIECYYTWVGKIKIPGFDEFEIQRKEYHVYMNYRYDEVYDYGNEEA